LIPQLSAIDDLKTVAAAFGLWASRAANPWVEAPDGHVRLAEKFLSLGSPLPAYDVATDGLKTWPDNVRLKQLQSLALIRVSAFQRARMILEALHANEAADSETIGLLASVHKSTGLSTQIARTRLRELRRARELYLDAFREFGLTWHGINAASLSLLLGQRRLATSMATEILKISLNELATGSGDRYWSSSTGGEAALLLGEVDQARELYAQAGAVRSTRVGDLVTTRRNALLVARYMGVDATWLDAVLPVPKVAVFAGHIIDLVGRPSPRFPETAVIAVEKAIRTVISELGDVVGYTSAAAGGDILFAEAVLDRGGELHVVLPQSWPGFSAESIEPHGIDWVRRAQLVLEKSASVTAVSDYRISSEGPAFSYGSRVLYGRARLHADRLQQSLFGLCVWDRKKGDGPGGTADAVRSWRRKGLEPTIIDPTVFTGSTKLAAIPDRRARRNRRRASIVAIMFADVAGYSRVDERFVQAFTNHYLGVAAKLFGKFTPVARNTWGDGLYAVFQDVGTAGTFAIALAARMAAIDWERKGLPADLGVRIGLHAGPVQRFVDPVTGIDNFAGAHITRAARIEPVAIPGQAFASQEFAALAAAEQRMGFRCEYVGQTQWAKHAGVQPTYVLIPT
jgi:class 3 adenylate cyclase